MKTNIKIATKTNLDGLITRNILYKLVNFRNKSKLELKLFFNMVLVIEKLMAGVAKMQITGVIEKVLMGKLLVNKKIVKNS